MRLSDSVAATAYSDSVAATLSRRETVDLAATLSRQESSDATSTQASQLRHRRRSLDTATVFL